MSGISIVYKQWYKSRNLPSTPTLNGKHLIYIATRKGAVPNRDCAFGLWGKTEAVGVHNIDNLKEAVAVVREASREHTLYRAVVSLDEETAVKKGLEGRNEWQSLVSRHAAVICKENGIRPEDFRWYAAYHHERGHPHVHLLFWDSSDRIREEHMPEKRFEIAMEKVRADFNKEVFREELQALQAEQAGEKKELRSFSRNLLDQDMTFLDEEEEGFRPRFYPKTLKQGEMAIIHTKLEQLLYLLPEKGQLQYKFLPNSVKIAMDALSESVINATTLRPHYLKYLDTARQIALTYGNSEEAADRQVEIIRSGVLKDAGNDLLRAIKDNGFLEQRTDARFEVLQGAAKERAVSTADALLAEKMDDTVFSSQLNDISGRFPRHLTPKGVVLQDEKIASGLRSLTLEVVRDDRLTQATRVSQAFGGGDKRADNNAFLEIYRYVNARLYDTAADHMKYKEQQQRTDVTGLLLAFCSVTGAHNRLIGHSGRFLMQRELSKLAKKEYAIAHKDSSNMWEGQSWY